LVSTDSLLVSVALILARSVVTPFFTRNLTSCCLAKDYFLNATILLRSDASACVLASNANLGLVIGQITMFLPVGANPCKCLA